MRLLLVLTGFFLMTQVKTNAQKSIKKLPKKWRCIVKIQDKTIDFTLEEKPGKIIPAQYILWNGTEKIDLNKNIKVGDSLYCPISVFESKLIFPIKLSNSFSGFYVNAKNQRLPFEAKLIPVTEGFSKSRIPTKYRGSWKLYFHDGGLPTDSGVLVTQLRGDSIYGTILTETGDYRFLNGRAGEVAYLQTIDGAHTYRFDYEAKNDSLFGSFIYGPKGTQLFYGLKIKEPILKDGFEITKAGSDEKFRFTAKDEEGKIINQSDALVRNKAVVLQILGSWCPNCLDETKFLTSAYAHKPKNVQFLGLAFERKPNLKQAYERINILKSRLKVPYPIFYGGMANKDSAKLAVPFLTKVFAFPTTVFIKSDGSIYKVHSGFTGPATGKFYSDWVSEFNTILKEIAPEGITK